MKIDLLHKRVLLTPAMFSNLLKMKMSHIQSPTLMKIGNRNRVYFCSRAISEKKEGNYVSRIYYVDFDNSFSEICDFAKVPVAELGDIGTFDQHGTSPISLVNFQGKNLMYYVGWSRSIDTPYAANIGLLKSASADGTHFERISPGPIISFDQDEPFLLGSPRIKEFNGMLYMWYVSGKSWNIIHGKPEPTYKIRMATSIDGVSWNKINRDLIKNLIDEYECQAAPEVVSLESGFLMIYSYRSNSRVKENSDYQVNFAYSDDLRNWNTEPISSSQKKMSLSMQNTSYYNLTQSGREYQALFQLEKMGRVGVGIGLLVVDKNE